jgi:hypothetical protein
MHNKRQRISFNPNNNNPTNNFRNANNNFRGDGGGGGGGGGGRPFRRPGGYNNNQPFYQQGHHHRNNNQPPQQQQSKMSPQELFAKMMVMITSDPESLPAQIVGGTSAFEMDVGSPQEQALIKVIIGCAGTWSHKVSEYAILLGALIGKSTLTRKLAVSIFIMACNEISTLQTSRERMLLRFIIASLVAGKGYALLKGEIQTFITSLLQQHNHEWGLVLVSILPWIFTSNKIITSNGNDDTIIDEELEKSWTLLLTECVRDPSIEYALPVQADKTDPTCDRLSLGLACLREGEGVIKFKTMLTTCSTHLPEIDILGNDSSIVEAFQNLQERLLTFNKTSSNNNINKSSQQCTTYLPLFPDGRSRKNVNPTIPQESTTATTTTSTTTTTTDDDSTTNSNNNIESSNTTTITTTTEIIPLSFAQRYLIREIICDIIDSFYPHHADAALELARLDSPLIVVEVLLSHLLTVPHQMIHNIFPTF